MDKTATIRISVDAAVKEQAEAVLEELGVPMSTAINMYLRQVIYTRSIPFPVVLPDNVLTSESDM